MKMRLGFLGSVLAVVMLPTLASASDFGVDLHGGTLGLGGELNYTLNDYFTVRGQFNKYSYNYTTTKEQIGYNFNLQLKTFGALIDWHPFAGTFRVSAGYFSNKNNVDALAQAQSSYTINGDTYTASQVGTLAGTITFNSSAPYLGIGWTTLGTKDTGLGFEFDLGALMQGSPTVNLSATGTAASNPTFQSDLAQEQTKFQNDVNSFKTYPVISLGLVYRF